MILLRSSNRVCFLIATATNKDTHVSNSERERDEPYDT